MFSWFRKRPPEEQRAAASGYTAELLSMREAYIAGNRGVAELTSTVQGCISLWENGLSLADVDGTSILTPSVLAMMARSLALRGEALFLIRDGGLVPCSDWDLSTKDGKPRAYRVSVSEAGGGRTETALAAEVLHVRIGADVSAPWAGVSPLRRARLTAGLLETVETALSEVYEFAPIGSQVIPFPESPGQDLEKLGRDFRGRRGRVMLRESVTVAAAGGPMPQQDWKPADATPDLERAMTSQTLTAAREAICHSFSVLPAMLAATTTGPLIREGQRHLASWCLQPLANLVAEEATLKLGGPVRIDTLRNLQAYDASGRARALATIIEAFGRAKEAGLEGAQLDEALKLVDWSGE